MTNPNRVAAYLPKNPSFYWTFPQPNMAARFAAAAKEMGLKVRESAFRIGPKKEFRRNYRVTVYWTGAEPDRVALDAAATRARDSVIAEQEN